MKNRTVRGITALTLGAALLLSACGNSDDTATPTPSASESTAPAPTAADIAALDAVVVAGDPGTKPTLTIAAPFTTSTEVSRLASEGTGDEILEGNLVGLQLVAYTGSDGVEMQSSWEDPVFEAALDGTDLPVALTEALVGQKVGARVLFAQPQTNQTDGTTQTVVFAVDALSTRPVPTRAEGEAVTPPADLPTVTLDDTGKPSISIPEGYVAPTELVAQPLIKGTGAVVESGQSIQVQYTGWKLSDGTEFDSSWEGTPLVTLIGTGKVIAGWDQGLVGQTVGSQVLLVIPKALAYGTEGSTSDLATEDLVFVVDILRAA
ncbi:peptidylprolyl isomerase [Sanguibacter gelidistatuariae]|uniref:Peptidyl-prolyl cis-trans isomerase n=1 Tax=Sanguibacter gelidistatuariae TaxID=1814289 RepID=A0A1G6VJ33_9MICO|nr:FKBP-type peptidyl-prolyl cis-trans isomerase [Sanguibacter gelidistatuariae]SDD52846.1 peptidylprolyl isomerase [Sanguibacter gelidistatuariae]